MNLVPVAVVAVIALVVLGGGKKAKAKKPADGTLDMPPDVDPEQAQPADIIPTEPGGDIPADITPADVTPTEPIEPEDVPVVPRPTAPEPTAPVPGDDDDGDKPVLPAQPAQPAGPSPAERPQAKATIAPDTLDLAKYLLAKEGKPGWKSHEARVQVWQEVRGLEADGLFGPITALTMAGEIGFVPLVRYWPRKSQKSVAVPEFQVGLERLAAAAEPPRREQLQAAAQREQGQGYAKKPVVPDVVIDLQEHFQGQPVPSGPPPGGFVDESEPGGGVPPGMIA